MEASDDDRLGIAALLYPSPTRLSYANLWRGEVWVASQSAYANLWRGEDWVASQFQSMINHRFRSRYKIEVTAIATSIHPDSVYSHLRLTKPDRRILQLDIFTVF